MSPHLLANIGQATWQASCCCGRTMSRPALRILLLPFAIGACDTTVGDPTPGEEIPVADVAREIDEYIRTLPYLPTEQTGIDGGEPSPPAREGDYQCVARNLTETRQFDRIVAYAANSDSLWP